MDAEKAYVRPSENVTCPSQPCLTFNHYARESDQYFVDNTTFVFLSGIHRLDVQLHLVSVSNVAFLVFDEVQEDQETVQAFLNPSVNITWTDCDNIEISGLVFVLSGRSVLFPALVFCRTISSLSQLTLLGNGTLQSTAIFIESSQINLINMTVSGAKGVTGAAVYAVNSTVDFVGQNSFISNTATGEGVQYHYMIAFLTSLETFHLSEILPPLEVQCHSPVAGTTFTEIFYLSTILPLSMEV